MHRRVVPLALGTLILIGFGPGTAFALPLGHRSDRAAVRAPSPVGTDGVDFTAIVALDDCSGSLVRFTNSQPDDPALVLTNGHCYEGGFLDPGQVLQNQASSRTFDLLGSDGSSTLGTLTATEIVYATMTTTDVTLYRLSSTYAQIAAKYDVQPLTIADTHPVAGTPIRIVSGYWQKIYSCSIDGFVYQLNEGDWSWQDSIRYQQPGCEVIGGTSGSPIIDANTKEIIGINNTTNENGERCTVDNPCEVDASGGVTVTRGAAYGQELYLFYGCLDASNQLDLSLATCQLPKPAR